MDGAVAGGAGQARAVATVVIGENMIERVIPYARRLGAGYYRPRSETPANWLRNNRQWLQRQMRRGLLIVDIGPDVQRRLMRGPSPFYEMEREAIRRRRYARYVWDPQP